MASLLLVDPRSIPADGRQLIGSLPPSFFDLPPGDPIQPVGALHFDLHITRDDDDLLVSGSLKARFRLNCVLCLEALEHQVDWSDYHEQIPIKNDQMIDLTESIREDILLTLPSYPRCEDGNVSPHDCSVGLEIPLVSEDSEEAAADQDNSGVWQALDQIKRSSPPHHG